MSGQEAARAKDEALEYVKTVGAVALVCVVLALALALVNALTAESSARRIEQQQIATLDRVMPGVDSYSEIWFDHTRAEQVLAAFSGTELKGYCVTVVSWGFGGEMDLLVGVSAAGAVTGVEILRHDESMRPGVLESKEFFDQFIGKSGTIRMGGDFNAVDAVSGATQTSEGVLQGVNTALSVVAELHGEEGDIGEEGTV